MDSEITDVQFPLLMTRKERQMLKMLGTKTDANGDERGESNTIRQALRLLMESEGLDTSDLFTDRRAGNRTKGPRRRKEA